VKTPPAASIRLGASRWYQVAVGLMGLALVAACAIFYLLAPGLKMQWMLIGIVAALALAWAVRDAGRPVQGALHYAQGEWVLARGDTETQGTLRVALDLQNYMLVRFTAAPLSALPQPAGVRPQPRITTLWLHLERQYVAPVGPQGYALPWAAMRRAVYAPTGDRAMSTEIEPA
jgi:hypothetical protein